MPCYALSVFAGFDVADLSEDAPDDVVGAEVEDKEQEKKDDSIGKHQSI